PDNGTINGGVTSTTGPNATYATARLYDGTSTTRIGTGTDLLNWNASSFSVAFWVNLTNNAVSPATGSQNYIMDEVVPSSNYVRIFNETGTGAVRASTSSTGIKSTTTLTNGAW